MPEWGQSVLGKHVDKFRRGTAFACVVPPQTADEQQMEQTGKQRQCTVQPSPRLACAAKRGLASCFVRSAEQVEVHALRAAEGRHGSSEGF